MRIALAIAFAVYVTNSIFGSEPAPTTILVVRLGPMVERGLHLFGSDRYLDIIESDITSPADFRRLPANLVLVPSQANKRFTKEEGRYAKLLLVETDLKERLDAGLGILIPPTLATAEKPGDLGEPTPVTMKLRDEKEHQKRSEPMAVRSTAIGSSLNVGLNHEDP